MQAGQPETTTEKNHTEEAPKSTQSTKTTPAAAHEVDSKYAERDIKLRKDSGDPCRMFKILIIILSVVLLLLGGFAIWYFAYYNQPEKVAFDAVENLLESDQLALQGGFTIVPKDLDDDDILKMILVSFDTSDKGLPNTSSAKLQLVFDANKVNLEHRLLLQAKNIIMQDGVIYLQISGLTESFQALAELESSEYDADAASYELPDEVEELLEKIDDEWWQISVNDIVAEMGVDDTQSSAIKDMYACVVDYMDSDLSNDYAKLYRDNRFVKVEPTKYLEPDDLAGHDLVGHSAIEKGHNVYTISVDKEKLANFLNEAPKTPAMRDFVSCYNQAGAKIGADPLDWEGAKPTTADDIGWPEDLRVAVEISRLGHKLRSFAVYYDNENIDLTGSALVEYQSHATTAPESYRPISELTEEIMNLVMAISGGSSPIEPPIDNCSPDGVYGESTNCYTYEGEIDFNEDNAWVY